MIETLHFKKRETILKLKAAVTNLSVRENLMYHCRRGKT
jgi:hypothetical protein